VFRFHLQPDSISTIGIDPLNYWSLWVPLGLLGLIVAMAVYFVSLDTRR